jgi:hypothetical protein
MERRASLLLLIILMGISISYAADLPDVDLPTLGIEFVLLVGLVSVGIIALLYMLGTSLEMPNLTAMAKEHLKELIVGAVIVVIVWAVVAGSDTLVGAIFLQDGVPEMGADAISNQISYLEMIYLNVADAYHTIAFYQSFSYFASIGLFYVYVGQGSSPYFGAGILLGPLSSAANTLTVQILTFRLLRIFTYYVSGVFPDFILPIALAFRLFPLTRKMGNTLIAICLGVIFVLPLSIIFVDDLWWSNTDAWEYKSSMESANSAHSYNFDNLGSGGFADAVFQIVEIVCGNVVIRTFLTLGEFIWAIIFATNFAASCLVGYAACWGVGFYVFLFTIWPIIVSYIQLAVGGTVLTLFAVDAMAQVGPAFTPIAKSLLPAVAEATGVSVVSFFMIVFITFTGIKSISAALGGDYILYGVSRFV